MKVTKGGRFTGLISNILASGVRVEDIGGYFTDDDLEAILQELGAGSAGAFLTVIGGEKGTVQALGNLGATEVIDLANANKFWGTLDQNCTITTVGWTNLKDCQISIELIWGGAGGWTPTFTGVTWVGGTPSWTTTAGTVTHIVLFSRDGGTTIYGAVVGSSDSEDKTLVTVAGTGATESVDCSVARTYDLTLTANCTLTLTGAVTAEAHFLTLILRQDSTGSRTVTWPASVVWASGSAPTLSTTPLDTDFVTLLSVNGGTTWFGFPAGGGASASDTQAWMPLTTVVSGVPELVWDANNSLIPTLVPLE